LADPESLGAPSLRRHQLGVRCWLTTASRSAAKKRRILECMRLRRSVGRMISFWVVSVLVVALAPAVLLAGELVNRHYLRQVFPRYRFWRVAPVLLSNPVWIALTAPGRWILDRLRPRAGGRRGRGGNGPPGAGVREPRRPLPDLPAGAMALPEPRSFL